MFDECVILALTFFVLCSIRSVVFQNPIANNKNRAFTRIVNSKLEMSKSETSRREFASSMLASIMIVCGSADDAFAQGHGMHTHCNVFQFILTYFEKIKYMLTKQKNVTCRIVDIAINSSVRTNKNYGFFITK